MEYYVYALVDKTKPCDIQNAYSITNLPIYIGRGKKSRCFDHFNIARRAIRNPHLPRSEKTQYIIDNFENVMILMILKNLSFDESNSKEKELISIFGRLDLLSGPLFNLTSGGQGCKDSRQFGPFNGFYKKKHSEETKNKTSLRFKGTKLTSDHKSKISNSKLGKKDSLVARESKRESLRKRFNDNPNQLMFQILGMRQSKEYEIQNPNGEIFLIKSLRKFCFENSLNAKTLKSAFLKNSEVTRGPSAGWKIIREI